MLFNGFLFSQGKVFPEINFSNISENFVKIRDLTRFHYKWKCGHIFDALECKFNQPAVCPLHHLFPTDEPFGDLFSDHKFYS